MKSSKNSKYHCILCDYSTNNKTGWYQHKKTNKHLMKMRENQPSTLVTQTENLVTQTENLVTQTDNLVTQTDNLVTQTENLVTQTENLVTQTIYVCGNCNQEFIHKNSYHRHKKHYCLGENDNCCKYCDKKYKKIKFLNNHMKKCNKRFDYEEKQAQTIINDNSTTNNITNNTINDNRQVTYNINIYGQEDTSKMITDDVYEQMMIKNPDKALRILMKHFYIDIKENRNVLYTNPRHTQCRIYDGEKWIYENINKVFHDRIKFISKNVMPEMNKRELLMIKTGTTGFINDEKEIKIDETIADILMAENARKEELEVSKKSKTYKDDLKYVNEQKQYKKELSDIKSRHLIDLCNISDDVKNIK
jgi:hypothetical protein